LASELAWMIMKGSCSGVGPLPEPTPSPAAFCRSSSGTSRLRKIRLRSPRCWISSSCSRDAHAVKHLALTTVVSADVHTVPVQCRACRTYIERISVRKSYLVIPQQLARLRGIAVVGL